MLQPQKSNLKLQGMSEHYSKMQLIQLEPLLYVNTDEAHILIPNSMLTVYNDLTNQVKDKIHRVLWKVQICKSTHLAGEVGS